MADNPVLPRFLQSVAKLRHRVNSAATDVGQRQRINWVDTASATFAVADDSINEEVTVSVSTVGAPPTGTAGGVLAGTYPNPTFAAPAWTTSHDPAVSAQTGTITTVGAKTFGYQKIGRTVHWRCSIVITVNGTGSGSLLFSLPFAVFTGTHSIGVGREIVTSGLALTVTGTGTTAIVVTYANAYPAVDTSSLILHGQYEATS